MKTLVVVVVIDILKLFVGDARLAEPTIRALDPGTASLGSLRKVLLFGVCLV